MTPYTSFLADERTSGRVASAPMGKGGGRFLAEKALARVAEPSGPEAQADAMTRQGLRRADRAPAPTAPGQAGGQMLGWGSAASYEAGKKEQVENIRQVGQQAVYRRGQVWVTADAAEVDLEKDKGKIQEIRRFSKEYFELVRANSVEENQVLASQSADEDLVIRLRGQLYRIR
jgi:Ca-activated chloride channel family protein